MSKTGKELLPEIIEAIQDRKGRKICVMDLSGIENAAVGRFIICEGSSTQNVASIADNIRDMLLEKEHVKPYNYDGYGSSTWIVVDYGDTMVHVFTPATRALYDLEGLWNDAVITEIPDLD